MEICALSSHSPISLIPPFPSPLDTNLFVRSSYNFVSISLIWFLDSIYEWNHIVFVFVWFIALSIIHSRNIHVFQMARLLSFSMWESYLVMSESLPPHGLYSPVHGILQARILEWVTFPFSRGSSQPRDWLHSFSMAE